MRTEQSTRDFALCVGRAVGGAVVFSLPLYMTMEMWELGFAMDRWRLALLTALSFPLLVGLSHVSGFEPTFDVRDDVVDALVAWAVGVATGTVGLLLLGVLDAGQSASEIVGKVALQAIPGSIGALLVNSQFSDGDGPGSAGNAGAEAADAKAADVEDGDEQRRRPDSYWSQLFVMLAGALFLAFNVAPTEEIVRIAYVIKPWRTLALVVATLVGMHAFVYKLGAPGQEPAHASTASMALRYTVVGYAIAVGISGYVLWTFGRLDATGPAEALTAVLVLAVPASIGAAAARLLL